MDLLDHKEKEEIQDCQVCVISFHFNLPVVNSNKHNTINTYSDFDSKIPVPLYRVCYNINTHMNKKFPDTYKLSRNMIIKWLHMF